MTSTNVNIGIEGRSSSRIMKPPGGGHTDIFGLSHEKVEVASSRYAKQSQQKSSISECFGYGASPPARKEVPVMKESNETAKPEASENGLKNGTPTPLEDENIKPTADVPPASQRVRVPPGGFSSGLW